MVGLTEEVVSLLTKSGTWLQSITGHLVTRDAIAFLRWWFRPDRYPHGPHDRTLAERGVSSVAAYLHAWTRHVDACTASIPAERRLVLRTHELDSSHRRLAGFLRIPVGTLHRAVGKLNRGTWSERIESFVDPAYLDTMIHSICGINMRRHFHEVRSSRDASGLWAG